MVLFCSTPHCRAHGHGIHTGNPLVAQKHLGGCHKPVELRAALRCSELYRWASVSPEIQKGQRHGKPSFVCFLSICHLHCWSHRVKFTAPVNWMEPGISGQIWPSVCILLVLGQHCKLNHRCLVVYILMMYFKPFYLRVWTVFFFLFFFSTAPSRKALTTINGDSSQTCNPHNKQVFMLLFWVAGWNFRVTTVWKSFRSQLPALQFRNNKKKDFFLFQKLSG